MIQRQTAVTARFLCYVHLLLFTFILHPPQELLPLLTFCCSPLYYTHLRSFFLCVPSAVHLYITPTSGASSSVYLLLFTFILHPPQELHFLCLPSAVHIDITPTSGASSSVYLLLFTFVLHPPQELAVTAHFLCLPSAVHLDITPTSGASSSVYLLLFTFILHPPQELLPLFTFCCSPLYYTHLRSFFLCVPSAVHLDITPTSGASSSVYLLLFTFILHPPQELLILTSVTAHFLCLPSAVHLYITPTSGASSSVYLLLFTFILHPPQELLPLCTFCCSPLYYTHLRSFSY